MGSLQNYFYGIKPFKFVSETEGNKNMLSRLISRAASTLVLGEHNVSGLNAATLNTITAATKIGGDVTVLLASDSTAEAAEAAQKVAGVSKVICADGIGLKGQLAE